MAKISLRKIIFHNQTPFISLPRDFVIKNNITKNSIVLAILNENAEDVVIKKLENVELIRNGKPHAKIISVYTD